MEMGQLSPWAQFGAAGLVLGVLVYFGTAVFRFAAQQIEAQLAAREADIKRADEVLRQQRAEYMASLREERTEFLAALLRQGSESRLALAEVETRLTRAIDSIVERLDQIAQRLEAHT